MKKYLILTLALLLVLVCSTLVTAYAGTCGCSESGLCEGLRKNPPECNLKGSDCSCSCCNQPDPDPTPSASAQPTPTPVTYYPDYDEEDDEPAAPAPVEEASPKTGDTAVTAAAMLLGIGAAAVVVTCVRKSRA